MQRIVVKRRIGQIRITALYVHHAKSSLISSSPNTKHATVIAQVSEGNVAEHGRKMMTRAKLSMIWSVTKPLSPRMPSANVVSQFHKKYSHPTLTVYEPTWCREAYQNNSYLLVTSFTHFTSENSFLCMSRAVWTQLVFINYTLFLTRHMCPFACVVLEY